jgi:Methyltransferase domain
VAAYRGETMIEIGSGTGAKTAAFAQVVERVLACDISEPHVRAARARVEALGLENVVLDTMDAQAFLDRIREEHPGGVGLCLLFAVLEHMTLEERLATLRGSWAALRPGGAMVVVETPNRLLPWDWHSSRLPFFNQLPDELALRYYGRSPRRDYVDAIRRGLEEGGEAGGLEALTRQGRGVSYHEFEVALGDLDPLVVADSYDPEIVEMNPLNRHELELKAFLAREGIDVPIAFSRYWLDLVLRKPEGR